MQDTIFPLWRRSTRTLYGTQHSVYHQQHTRLLY